MVFQKRHVRTKLDIYLFIIELIIQYILKCFYINALILCAIIIIPYKRQGARS